MAWRDATREASPSSPPRSLSGQGKRVRVKHAAGGSSSPDAAVHRHHDRRPSGKKARASSPSSSFSSVCLFERKIYGVDLGQMKDGLRVAQEKAAAVGRVLMEEEKALADSGRGAALAIQDEQGRRYSVFWRRRRVDSTHYMICGAGWAHFAKNNQLHTGDVLRFCFSRAVPREGSGRLYLGVRILRPAPVAGGGDLVPAPAAQTTGNTAAVLQKKPSPFFPAPPHPNTSPELILGENRDNAPLLKCS